MKTAISVEDEILQQADEVAREIGVSRSRLFSIAMREFLRDRRRASILEQLNKVHSGPSADTSTSRSIKRKVRATLKDQW